MTTDDLEIQVHEEEDEIEFVRRPPIREMSPVTFFHGTDGWPQGDFRPKNTSDQIETSPGPEPTEIQDPHESIIPPPPVGVFPGSVKPTKKAAIPIK